MSDKKGIIAASVIAVLLTACLVILFLSGCGQVGQNYMRASGYLNEESVSMPAETNAEKSQINTDKYDGISIDEEHFPDEDIRNYISENVDNDQDGILEADEINKIVNKFSFLQTMLR